MQKFKERYVPYVFNANTGKIIFRVPEVEASMKNVVILFTCALLDFTSTKFMLECEWFITTSDKSALDDATAPVALWPYWSFRNVKLQCGAGGLTTIEVYPQLYSYNIRFITFRILDHSTV